MATTSGIGGAGNLILPSLITGPGGLTKVGTGTLLINGSSNTYQGDTTISAGTLGVGAVGALGTGNVFVSGGTLTPTVANAINGSQVVNVTSGTANMNLAMSYTGGTNGRAAP